MRLTNGIWPPNERVGGERSRSTVATPGDLHEREDYGLAPPRRQPEGAMVVFPAGYHGHHVPRPRRRRARVSRRLRWGWRHVGASDGGHHVARRRLVRARARADGLAHANAAFCCRPHARDRCAGRARMEPQACGRSGAAVDRFRLARADWRSARSLLPERARRRQLLRRSVPRDGFARHRARLAMAFSHYRRGLRRRRRACGDLTRLPRGPLPERRRGRCVDRRARRRRHRSALCGARALSACR